MVDLVKENEKKRNWGRNMNPTKKFNLLIRLQHFDVYHESRGMKLFLNHNNINFNLKIETQIFKFLDC